MGLTLNTLSNLELDQAVDQFKEASPREQSMLLHAYRDKVRKGKARSEHLRQVFNQITDYEKGVDPVARIERILEDLKSSFQGNSDQPSGYDRLTEYCRKLEVDEGTAWEDVKYFEQQRLAIRLYLKDLDAAHEHDLSDERHLTMRYSIERQLMPLFDVARSDTDRDGVLDYKDSTPRVRGNPKFKTRPYDYAESFRQIASERLYAKGNRLVLENRGADKPLLIVVPILLVAVDPVVDVNVIVRKEQQVEKKLNSLLPKEWRNEFKIDVRFFTNPQMALLQSEEMPFSVVRVNSHPVSDSRAHSYNWSVTDNIKTLAHEVGHHLGWPDRYSEHFTKREHVLDTGWYHWSKGDLMACDNRYVYEHDLHKTMRNFSKNPEMQKNPHANERVEAENRRLIVQAASWRGDSETAFYLSAGRWEEEPIYYYYIGRSYENSNPEKAAEYYEKAIRHYKKICTSCRWDDCYWFIQVGEFYRKRGEVDISKELYRRVLSVSEDNAGALYHLWKLEGEDVTAATQAALERSVAADPKDLNRHYFMARFYYDRKNYKLAKKHFKETFESDDSSLWETLYVYPGPERFLLYGKTLEKTKHPKSALKIYAKGLLVDPNNRKLKRSIVRLGSKSDNFTAGSFKAFMSLVKLYMDKRDRKMAIQVLNLMGRYARKDYGSRYKADPLIRSALRDWKTYGPHLIGDDYDVTFLEERFRFDDKELQGKFVQAILATYSKERDRRSSVSHSDNNIISMLMRNGAELHDLDLIVQGARLKSSFEGWVVRNNAKVPFSLSELLELHERLRDSGKEGPGFFLWLFEVAIHEKKRPVVDQLLTEYLFLGIAKPLLCDFGAGPPFDENAGRAKILAILFKYYQVQGDTEKVDKVTSIFIENPFPVNCERDADVRLFIGHVKKVTENFSGIKDVFKLNEDKIPMAVAASFQRFEQAVEAGRFHDAETTLEEIKRYTNVLVFFDYFLSGDKCDDYEHSTHSYPPSFALAHIARLRLEITQDGESYEKLAKLGSLFRFVYEKTGDERWLKKGIDAALNAYLLFKGEYRPTVQTFELASGYMKLGDRGEAQKWLAEEAELNPELVANMSDDELHDMVLRNIIIHVIYHGCEAF